MTGLDLAPIAAAMEQVVAGVWRAELRKLGVLDPDTTLVAVQRATRCPDCNAHPLYRCDHDIARSRR